MSASAPDKQLTAAAYERVSVAKGASVPEQAAENDSEAQAHGWTVAHRYQEPGDASASRYSTTVREEWNRLMADLQAGRFAVLILWESSRGSRRLGEWITLLDTCQELGVLIHVTSDDHTYNLNKPRDRHALVSAGSDAELESANISKRMRRTMHGQAEAGRPHGRIPYGLRRRYDAETKALIAQEAHPEQASIVRELFERFAAGESLNALCGDLNRRGISPVTGNQWNRVSVRALLTKRIYIGERVHHGEVYTVDSPKLVPEDTFWAVQQILGDHATRRTRQQYKPGKAKYLLSGRTAQCAACGAALAMTLRQMRYACKNGHTSIKAEWADEIVLAALAARLVDPAVLAALAQASNTAEQAEAARAELARLRNRLGELRDSAADVDGISPAMLAKAEGKLTPEIAAAERKVAELSTPPALSNVLGDNRPSDLDAMYDRIVGLSVTQQRELIGLLCASISIRVRTEQTRPTGPEPWRIEIEWA